MRVAILDDYLNLALQSADWSRVADQCEIVVFDRPLSLEEAPAALAEFDAVCLLRERMDFPGALIAQLPRLRLLLITGAQNRTLDLAAATARGIPVVHTVYRPGIAPATPELAWALVMAAARDIPAQDASTREGRWQTSAGIILHGKTLGLLGLGRVGRQMVKYGVAFGMKVVAWSQNMTAEAAAEAGAERVEKDDLFRLSDVLSLHVVLSERTRGLVGARELALMKSGAILINTARGPLVEEAALVEALKAGRIRAGLDVYDHEPLPAGHPLTRTPNTVLAPHLGYVAQETYKVFYGDVLEGLEAFLAGRPIRVANADVLAGRPGGGEYSGGG